MRRARAEADALHQRRPTCRSLAKLKDARPVYPLPRTAVRYSADLFPRRERVLHARSAGLSSGTCRSSSVSIVVFLM